MTRPAAQPDLSSILARLEQLEAQAVLFEKHRQEWIAHCEADKLFAQKLREELDEWEEWKKTHPL